MRAMEHPQDAIGAPIMTIFFAWLSILFKASDGIIQADSYILLPLMHLVSIIAGMCAIISFLFVLHPPLKKKLMNFLGRW